MSTATRPSPPAYTLQPVGYVRAQAGRFQIEISPPYRAGLRELDRFSHVLIFWWAHQNDTAQDRATVTTPLPYAPGVEAGVFACRTPVRPNPIGLTTMPVMNIDVASGIVDLPWLDAVDGTPVLDLKPYIPISDRIRDVRVAEWFADWPQWMEDAGEFFARHAPDLGS